MPRGKLFGLVDLADDIDAVLRRAGDLRRGLPADRAHRAFAFGQVLKAIRENEPRAISLGYDVDRYKLLAFVLSAALAGLAGATKTLVLGFATLTDVHWSCPATGRADDAGGRHGHVAGPIVGAFIIVALENKLGDIGISWPRDRHRMVQRPGRIGHDGHRRDLRGLRAGVPPRHRGRTDRVEGAPQGRANLGCN